MVGLFAAPEVSRFYGGSQPGIRPTREREKKNAAQVKPARRSQPSCATALLIAEVKRLDHANAGATILPAQDNGVPTGSERAQDCRLFRM